MTPDDPKILRTVRGYCLEWGYRYHQGKFINQLDPKDQFQFLPGCFDRSIAKNDIPLTMDLDGKSIFARTGDNTLTLESDDVGLLVTARLIDSDMNRELCRLIDSGKVRGWSHRSQPWLGGFRFVTEGDIRLRKLRMCGLSEVTLVIKKWPRAKTRKTPIFLAGGPVAKVVAHAQ